MSENEPKQQSEKLVRLHTQIDKPGAILEVRPEGQDYSSERDMSHLSREEARDVYEQLGSFLGVNCGNDRSSDTGSDRQEADRDV